jgi:hypothetical protein
MRRLFVIALLFSCASSFAITADDIIDKYIEATGGADKWARVYTLRYTANYVLGPGMLAPVNVLITSRPFRGYYSDFSWQGMTNKTSLRADSGWTYNPFGGKRESDPMAPDEIRSLRLEDDPQGLLFNYKQKGYSVDYLGTDDMDGTDVYKLRLTTKDGDMVYFYIDQDSYYILKTMTRIKLKDREEKSYTVYSDFRKTDFGITIPFSQQTVDENGNEQGGPVNITRVEVNGTVDQTVFNKPQGRNM